MNWSSFAVGYWFGTIFTLTFYIIIKRMSHYNDKCKIYIREDEVIIEAQIDGTGNEFTINREDLLKKLDEVGKNANIRTAKKG